MNNAPLFQLPHLMMQYFAPECIFNENDNHANTQNYKFNTNNSIIQHFQMNEQHHLPIIDKQYHIFWAITQ